MKPQSTQILENYPLNKTEILNTISPQHVL